MSFEGYVSGIDHVLHLLYPIACHFPDEANRCLMLPASEDERLHSPSLKNIMFVD
jgi:hypothetical protein